jgi:hypothetical protein
LSTVLGALSEVGTQLVQYVDHTAERPTVIDTSVELQERERTLSTESLRDTIATDGGHGHPG